MPGRPGPCVASWGQSPSPALCAAGSRRAGARTPGGGTSRLGSGVPPQPVTGRPPSAPAGTRGRPRSSAPRHPGRSFLPAALGVEALIPPHAVIEADAVAVSPPAPQRLEGVLRTRGGLPPPAARQRPPSPPALPQPRVACSILETFVRSHPARTASSLAVSPAPSRSSRSRSARTWRACWALDDDACIRRAGQRSWYSPCGTATLDSVVACSRRSGCAWRLPPAPPARAANSGQACAPIRVSPDDS